MIGQKILNIYNGFFKLFTSEVPLDSEVGISSLVLFENIKERNYVITSIYGNPLLKHIITEEVEKGVINPKLFLHSY